MRSWTLSTSSFTFEADIGAYFISKLPWFYAKRLEHIFAEDKEIIEFLEKKADEVSNMEHDRFHWDLIVIKAPHDNWRIKWIKGIGQQACSLYKHPFCLIILCIILLSNVFQLIKDAIFWIICSNNSLLNIKIIK